MTYGGQTILESKSYYNRLQLCSATFYVLWLLAVITWAKCRFFFAQIRKPRSKDKPIGRSFGRLEILKSHFGKKVGGGRCRKIEREI